MYSRREPLQPQDSRPNTLSLVLRSPRAGGGRLARAPRNTIEQYIHPHELRVVECETSIPSMSRQPLSVGASTGDEALALERRIEGHLRIVHANRIRTQLQVVSGQALILALQHPNGCEKFARLEHALSSMRLGSRAGGAGKRRDWGGEGPHG